MRSTTGMELPIAATVLIGFISLSNTLFIFFKWLWITFFRTPKNLKHYGSWALITGCTDGIGKALSFEVASKGLNLILVGRNPQKLQNVCDKISNLYKQVEVRQVILDFAENSNHQVVEKIEEAIKGLDVGVLINNVGLSYPYPNFFDEVEPKVVDDVIRVNVDAMTWVTRAVLPGMMKKKKGAIVNIGSGSGSSSIVSSYPLFAVYAATKGYIGMLSRSMSLEYKQQGIDIQCQMPLLVATRMAAIKKSQFFVPSPKMYSKASIRCIGYEYTCSPYWTHSIQCCLMHVLPDIIIDTFLLYYFTNVRKKRQLKDSMRNKKIP